ncbi:unnamed protein product [Onchocerca ochengi]|uniref:Ovule protein n=1 Tax=Onchocerca ochengi TaxID=42157 RepID=A0A182EVP6_ONCOC|nr:unnamed protein product [Onchocerca ochengi]
MMSIYIRVWIQEYQLNTSLFHLNICYTTMICTNGSYNLRPKSSTLTTATLLFVAARFLFLNTKRATAEY